MTRIYCMIIGDIVKSQRIDAAERASMQEKLKEALATINFEYDIFICSRFSITLGDEFQGGLYNTIPLFEILKLIQKSIFPHKIRFGIGIDCLNTHIQYNNSLSTDGPAYYKARQAVEELKSLDTFEYGYRIYTYNNDSLLINPLLNSIDCISSEWTDKQKEYINALHKNETVASLSNRKGVSVSTVSRALRRSNYKIVNDSLHDMSVYLYERYDISNDSEGFSSVYNKTCRLYRDKSYDKALKCINSVHAIEDLDCLNKYFILTSIYYQLGLNQRSTESALSALGYISADYKFIEIRLLNYLGSNYFIAKEYEEAEKYLHKALELLSTEEYTLKWYMAVKGNIALLNKSQNNFKVAETIFKEIYDIACEKYPDDASLQVTALANLSRAYFERREFDKCDQICKKALDIASKELNNTSNQTAFLLYISAKLALETENNTQRAMELLAQSSVIYKKNKNYSGELAIYKLLFDLSTKNNENIMAEIYEKKIQKLETELNTLFG